jgi:hypothetical protein
MDSPPARSLARGAATVFPLWLLALIPGEARAADLSYAYATYGIHNDAHQSLCQHAGCVYPRGEKDPSDPDYPAYWTSRWTMYRVFKGYETSQPPYLGPPPGLNEGEDYQASSGVTYYDSTWKGASGEGAMEEHYEGWCLPIFPFSNKYSCSFISLADVAFFVTYDDRPKWMPKVCLFSPRNHPPGRDFIKHLRYSESDSACRFAIGSCFAPKIVAAHFALAGFRPPALITPWSLAAILSGANFSGSSIWRWRWVTPRAWIARCSCANES